MAAESLSNHPTEQQVIIVQTGEPASVVNISQPTEDETRTQIEHAKNPQILEIRTLRTRREIEAAIARVTSESHGVFTRQQQDKMAERLRKPQGE